MMAFNLICRFAYLIIVASHHIPPAFASNTHIANQAANQRLLAFGSCEFAQRQRAPVMDAACLMMRAL